MPYCVPISSRRPARCSAHSIHPRARRWSRADIGRGPARLAGYILRVPAEREPTVVDAPDLKAPDLYINRELSFLEFNQRVLALAFDETVPLLERLNFLCISSSNLDEFFEIRVAGLKHLEELGSAQLAPDALTIPEQLAAIHARASDLVGEQYRCLDQVLLPRLRDAGIDLLGRKDWPEETRRW